MNPVLDPVIAQRVHAGKPITVRQVFRHRKVNQAAHQVFTSDFTFCFTSGVGLLFAHSNLVGPAIGE